MGHDGEAGEASPVSQDRQGRRVQRDPLRGGGAGLPLRAPRPHGRLSGQGSLDRGNQGRVPPVPLVSGEEEEVTQTPTRTSCKKLGRGNLGREASPPEPRQPEGGEATSRGKGDSAAAARVEHKSDRP
jgi:hypothetical protein